MAKDFEDFCGGQFWNETLTWGLNTTWPQFTQCFQNTVLIWVPCGWLWITLPLYLYYLTTRRERPLMLSWLNITKSFCGLLLFLLAVVEIIQSAGDQQDDGDVPQSFYLTPSVKAATLLLSVVLIQIERFCGFITSGVQFIFWLLLTLGAIVPFYTFIILRDDSVVVTAIFYVEFGITLIQFLLHCKAERLPADYFQYSDRMACPEVRGSFLSRISFWWINGLVLTGYRKTLEDSDLWDLNPRDQGANFIPPFERAWLRELERVRNLPSPKPSSSAYYKTSYHDQDEKTPLLNGSSTRGEVSFKGGNYGAKKEEAQAKKRTASLLKVLAKTFGPTLLISWGCKFIYDLLQFVSPMILKLLIGFTEDKRIQDWKGYIFALGLLVTATVQSTFFHQQFHVGMTLGMRIKAAVIAAVYKKALTMNNEARKISTVGEIVNLMSVDAQRLQDITGYLWMLWSAPLQIGLALYLLYGTMGSAIFAGLAIMVLMLPINAVIAVKTRKLQVQQMKLKDSRIKLMNEVLNGMKVLKLYAWELSFQEKILTIRNQELTVLRKTAYLGAFSTFAWTCAPFMVTLATFMTYVLTSEDHHLDAEKAFVALSLFNILRFPINLLPMLVSYIVQAQVSIGRIGKFLQNGDLNPDNVQHNPNSANPITVERGQFSWDTEEKATLRNVNLDVKDGQLLAVVGQVGAGKSSLISALLGEMEKTEGRVNVRGSVAFVPQQAWIQNATLKDNILFGEELREDDYKKIIEACALGPDLEMLPAGDMTEIGEKGINLSGGQKQRVALARAVYNNADIYLLDDPLSAVDAHVGKHIFEQVVGAKGLLKNKTRILVTHGIHWLPMVDQVAVITDGEISEIGSYEELMSHDGAFALFIHTYLTEEAESSDEDDPEVAELKARMLERVDSVLSDGEHTSGDEGVRRRSRKLSERASEAESDHERRRLKRQESKKLLERSLSKDVKAVKDEKAAGDTLIEAEKSETGKVKYSVYFTYARAIGVLASFLVIVLFALYQVGSVYSNVWLSQWTEDPVLKNSSLSNTQEYTDKNNLYLGVYGGLGLAQAAFVLLYAIVFATSQVKAAAGLHLGMLANMLRSPMAFFDTTPIGRIVNRFSRDIETIDNNLPQIIRMFMNTMYTVASTVVVISFSTPIFLTVIIPLGIFYFLIQRFYIPTSRQLKRIESTTRSPIYTHFSETITGCSTVRAYGQQDRFITESQNRVDRNLIFYFSGIASNRWLGFRLEIVGNLIVLAAAMFAVAQRNTLSGGIVGLSITYALQITASLNWMVRMTSDLETNIVSVERVKEYSETPTEAEWYLPNHRPHRDWPPTGVLEFQDYTTRYRPGLDLVLKGITCSVSGGEKIGIVGRTGAGKSSLTVALFRLIEAAGGAIVIDGVKISDIGLHDLRSKLTILPQDPVIFSGTLRMNIDPFDRYTDDDLWMALEHSHLKAFVENLPARLEHECGEGGQNLSVGQRQLVCLARTLLRKTKILILDEATAAVDMETDDLIQKTIRTEFKDCTVVTIAHRLNTIMDYDRIIVLDQGLIKEFGSPEKLLANKQGAFYSMAKDAGLV